MNLSTTQISSFTFEPHEDQNHPLLNRLGALRIKRRKKTVRPATLLQTGRLHRRSNHIEAVLVRDEISGRTRCFIRNKEWIPDLGRLDYKWREQVAQKNYLQWEPVKELTDEQENPQEAQKAPSP